MMDAGPPSAQCRTSRSNLSLILNPNPEPGIPRHHGNEPIPPGWKGSWPRTGSAPTTRASGMRPDRLALNLTLRGSSASL